MDKPEENMLNAGIVFMFIAWLQSQMSDLIILKKNPNLVSDFIASSEKVPGAFHKIRVTYWEKQFGSVKSEFKKLFSEHLSDTEKENIEEIYHLRNMIAHAHVSVGRDYMLYRPSGDSRREQKLIDDLKLQPIADQASPMVLKIELCNKEKFMAVSKLIERFDQVTLKKIADNLGIPHGSIR